VRLTLFYRIPSLIQVEADALTEALVTHHPPEAAIGGHPDAPAFGARW
jgi:hypothetical protein